MDEYLRQQAIQNLGGCCEHCGSALGHKSICPLLNRSMAEERSASTARVLSPYQHELNGSGTACAPDCPACTWVEEQRDKRSVALFNQNTNAGFYRRAQGITPDIAELDRMFKLEDNR